MIKIPIIWVLLLLSVLLGCGPKAIKREIKLDVTKPNKIKFVGNRGEKVSIKFNGTYSGTIKVAMISNDNKLHVKNFSFYKDSINLNIGTIDIYQDSTGFTWYVLPVDAASGKVLVSMTEYRY